MKLYKICFDLDNTLCENRLSDQAYIDVPPKPGAVEYLKELKQKGYYIIIHTARNMLTYNNNLGQIIANQAPIVIEWLKKHDITYDELLFGKPLADYYVDDKAVTFTDFKTLKKQLDV
jgi:capsule biosynthesis phosphatase